MRSKGKQRKTESRYDQRRERGVSEVEDTERKFKRGDKKDKQGESAETNELSTDHLEEESCEEDEKDVEDIEGSDESGKEDVSFVERSIQVLDGHIKLGTVQWKGAQAKVASKGS